MVMYFEKYLKLKRRLFKHCSTLGMQKIILKSKTVHLFLMNKKHPIANLIFWWLKTRKLSLLLHALFQDSSKLPPEINLISNCQKNNFFSNQSLLWENAGSIKFNIREIITNPLCKECFELTQMNIDSVVDPNAAVAIASMLAFRQRK